MQAIRALAKQIEVSAIDAAKAKCIMDFGKSFETIDDHGEKTAIPRYSVWGDLGRGKDEVLDASNSLPYLKKKWDIDAVIPWGSHKHE